MKQLLIALICIGLTSCAKVHDWEIELAKEKCKAVKAEFAWIRSDAKLARCTNGKAVEL